MIILMRLLLVMILSSTMGSPVHAGTDTEALKIYFLDIGLGDATLIHQPGICTALVDAGPAINGYRVTRKLQELGVSELDLVIITHPHLDHFGGLFDLHSRISIKEIYDNGRNNPAQEYFSDYQKILEKQIYRTITKGDTITCGDLTFTALHPQDHEQEGKTLNETSLVLMISYKSFHLLNMGDLAGPAETLFLDNADDITADVIKIAHHGAEDATSGRLLDRVNPQLAIISTSVDNWIDAPSPRVLERLKKRRISYLRTDQHKTIQLVVSRNGQFSFLHGSAGK